MSHQLRWQKMTRFGCEPGHMVDQVTLLVMGVLSTAQAWGEELHVCLGDILSTCDFLDIDETHDSLDFCRVHPKPAEAFIRET